VARYARLLLPDLSCRGSLERQAVRSRSGPALWQDLAQVVDTIASLQHIYHVLGKLGMANRAEAVDPGHQPGLIP
jgi:hypothetical protein